MVANRMANWMAIAAIVFGVGTVLTGGRALFGSLESRADFGKAVPFVLWFNFLAGFFFIVSGAGLLLCRRWAVYTSLCVAVSTIFVFVAFGVHVISWAARAQKRDDTVREFWKALCDRFDISTTAPESTPARFLGPLRGRVYPRASVRKPAAA